MNHVVMNRAELKDMMGTAATDEDASEFLAALIDMGMATRGPGEGWSLSDLGWERWESVLKMVFG